MKNYIYLILFLVLTSCGGSEKSNSDQTNENDSASTIIEDNIPNDPIEVVNPEISDTLSAEDQEKEKELQIALSEKILSFIALIQEDNFTDAQTYMHPKGCYYYTLGRIKPHHFTPATLENRKGFLDGAYAYAENEVFPINGLFWLDSLRYNYQYDQPEWYTAYASVAYGFTGNCCSNHVVDPLDYDVSSAEFNTRIAYMNHTSPEIDSRDILMIEFFQDPKDEDIWKIYAIGNLEWTP